LESGIAHETFPNQKATLFALRQVTRADAGSDYDEWRRELPNLLKVVRGKGRE
jgi:hypothetical protein